MMAEVRLEGSDDSVRIRVRNLSSGGMMAEGEMSVLRGSRLAICLRNVGWVDGTVAWVQDNRFGIAFAKEIDPKQVRAPIGDADLSTPRYLRSAALTAGAMQDAASLRKI